MDKLYYRKNKNNLKHLEILELEHIQNYIPIYSTFFTLNDTNWNNINLNQSLTIQKIGKNIKKNSYDCTLLDDKNNVVEKPVFFKFSPLVDPFKYIIGMYSQDNILNLPSLTNQSSCNNKIIDPNNSGYTDGFFYYLSSKLLNDYHFVHGIDFYGSYLAIKNNFEFNVYDDFDYVKNNTYVIKYYNKLFQFNQELGEIFFRDSKTSKPKLNIDDESKIELPIVDLEQIQTSTPELDELKDITDTFVNNDEEEDHLSECSIDTEDSNTVSDGSCVTEILSDYSESSDEEDQESYMSEDEVVNMTIYKMPVHVIAIEKCKYTLDHLINNELPDKELIAALFQIIMILITYQKVFDFTHNDLHTNNVMFIETNEKFLYYCYENVHYKVPTYGKIFKIIDFGRSIYTYNGVQIVSDSFGPNGDAKTQYNIPPYVNNAKPLLYPNYSFDLCRLACSLFDMFEYNDNSKIKKLIDELCKDDKGRNILYKKDGEERYPDFKLYKMIARTAHQHTPKNQLNKEIFKSFITDKVNSKEMNIDSYPSCISSKL